MKNIRRKGSFKRERRAYKLFQPYVQETITTLSDFPRSDNAVFLSCGTC